MGLAFLITAEHLHLLSERKVLKADEYGALLDANEVIGTAQREASRVRQDAERDVKQRLRDGYDKGWREAEAEHARRHLAQAWQTEHAVHAQREAMARLVVESLAQSLGELPPALRYEAVLRRMEAMWADEPVVTLWVAAGAREEAETAVRRVLEGTRHTGQVHICIDDALTGDECRVQTASGKIEMGLQAQVEALRRALNAPAVPR
jgi:type III secretion protein L